MSSIEVKSFSSADEVNTNFNNARIEAVNVGGQRVLKLTLQPGWKWSDDVKPTVGTESCQATHLGVIVEGSVKAIHNDGTEATYLLFVGVAKGKILGLVNLSISRVNRCELYSRSIYIVRSVIAFIINYKILMA